jgi:redox-sensitive bicupin YhaK (pirin superfamily)
MKCGDQMKIVVYPPDQQGIGAFDGGKITEQKPIGFPGEGSAVKRVGPLFYWAWFYAKEEGFIPAHPHQAFEIMTYVIQGKAEHGDSLGTKSVVGTGGAQVMQTGSGVYHEERFIGPDMEGFQIWFEPYLNEALKRKPTYNQYEDEAFSVSNRKGYEIKTVIGKASPVQLVADVRMWDIQVKPGNVYKHTIPAGYSLATLAIRGDGIWQYEKDDFVRAQFQQKDFIVLDAESETEAVLQADKNYELRMILIEVPTQTDYPLYPKR